MTENNRPAALPQKAAQNALPLPAAWVRFIRFCNELGHGEIEQLKIQDGLPVLAEMARKKVRFTEIR